MNIWMNSQHYYCSLTSKMLLSTELYTDEELANWYVFLICQTQLAQYHSMMKNKHSTQIMELCRRYEQILDTYGPFMDELLRNLDENICIALIKNAKRMYLDIYRQMTTEERKYVFRNLQKELKGICPFNNNI